MWNAFIAIKHTFSTNIGLPFCTTIFMLLKYYPFCCHGDNTPTVCCRKNTLPFGFQRHHIRITVKWFSCGLFEGDENAMWVVCSRYGKMMWNVWSEKVHACLRSRWLCATSKPAFFSNLWFTDCSCMVLAKWVVCSHWVIFCATSKRAFLARYCSLTAHAWHCPNASCTVGYFVDTHSETHGNELH